MLLPNILIAFSDFGVGWAGIKFTASKKWPSSAVFASNIIFIIIRLALIGILGILGISFVYFYSDVLFPGIPANFLYLGLLQTVGLAIQGMMLPIFLGLDRALNYSLSFTLLLS